MATNGTNNIAIGGSFFIGGMALTFLTHSAAQPGSRYVVFYGAVLFGGIQCLIGLIQYFNAPQVTDPLKREDTELKLLLRAMVGAAELSGGLDSTRIELIRSTLMRVFGRNYDAATVAEACRNVQGEQQDLTSHLFSDGSKLPVEMRQNILRASALVVGSDIPEETREFLMYVSRALLLPDEAFSENIAKPDLFSRPAQASI